MRSTYQLAFPEGLEHGQVLRFTRALSTRPRRGFWRVADPVVLEVVSASGALCWTISMEQREETLVLSALRAALPSMSLTKIDATAAVPSRAWELRLNTSRRSLNAESGDEVASALLAALMHTGQGEVVRVQWLIGPWLTRKVVQPPPKGQEHGLFELEHLVRNQEEARAWRDKQSEPLFGVVGRIGITAKGEPRVRQLRQRVVGALQLTRMPGVGFQRRWVPSWIVPGRMTHLTQPVFGWPSVLNAAELAAVLGWPIGNPVVAGLSYSGHRQLPPVAGTMVADHGQKLPAGMRVTGQATFPGQEGLLVLPEAAALHHLHIIGPTGTGKSTLLANLALQDIRAGRGVVVIDPGAKGDLVRDIAARIPGGRISDVVLLDPSDQTPVGLNVLAGSDPELVVDSLVHVFHELWAAHWGPRTADVLHHGLLTLAKVPGMTLCELPQLLLNAGFRQRVLQRLGDDALGVGPFWSWYQALGDAERATVVGPVLNKLRAFTQREAIRGVIGQAVGYDLASVMRERKVLLVNLSSGSLGSETAQLLGALIMAKVWQAVTARSAASSSERSPVFVYVDEFQQTLRLPLDLSDALVQARGLGVGLVLAHQHLGQLPTQVRTSLLGNAGSRIVFGLRAADAAVMAKELGNGLTTDDVQGLPAFETYQALHASSGRTRPASARTLPLTTDLGSNEAVCAASRKRYGTARSQVDAELLKRREPPKSDNSVGTRKRGGRP